MPLVGTMASGIPYLGAPFAAVLTRRYQRYRPYIAWVGWPLCILGLAVGSFADSLGALIVTQGIMYGGESFFFLFGLFAALPFSIRLLFYR